MKRDIFNKLLNTVLFVLAIFTQQLVLAQDSTVSSTTHTVTKSTEFVMQPWMWIVGGVVVLLIIVALFSGGRSTNNEVTKTTVIKERL